MKQKGQSAILMLLGILILVGVAGGAYFLGSQTPPKPQNPVVTSSPQSTMVSQNIPSSVVDETVNWKTYTSTKYGYSFKYPDSLEITLDVDFSSLRNPTWLQSMDITKKGTNHSILIEISGSKAPSSLEDWLKQTDQESNMVRILYSRRLNIDGVIAIQRHERRIGAGMGEEDKEYETERVYIVFGNKFMMVTATHSDEFLSYLNDLLFTFKVLDSESSSE